MLTWGKEACHPGSQVEQECHKGMPHRNASTRMPQSSWGSFPSPAKNLCFSRIHTRNPFTKDMHQAPCATPVASGFTLLGYNFIPGISRATSHAPLIKRKREKRKEKGILSNLLRCSVHTITRVLTANAKKINCFLFLRGPSLYSPLGSTYPTWVFPLSSEFLSFS